MSEPTLAEIAALIEQYTHPSIRDLTTRRLAEACQTLFQIVYEVHFAVTVILGKYAAHRVGCGCCLGRASWQPEDATSCTCGLAQIVAGLDLKGATDAQP